MPLAADRRNAKLPRPDQRARSSNAGDQVEAEGGRGGRHVGLRPAHSGQARRPHAERPTAHHKDLRGEGKQRAKKPAGAAGKDQEGRALRGLRPLLHARWRPAPTELGSGGRRGGAAAHRRALQVPARDQGAGASGDVRVTSSVGSSAVGYTSSCAMGNTFRARCNACARLRFVEGGCIGCPCGVVNHAELCAGRHLAPRGLLRVVFRESRWYVTCTLQY
ncbi:hypothetical protein EMIHUDRAFT_453382 [Emiliania huxleyi CCMP1516]|uniref:Zinc finger PHD-type domain-containing protein n=2 Tax=Emiliania huxleyi TaxID=2903 RepID=A0A0D3I6V2_EMIH1|nr:hypothetical protein EMIHUDRAFT_453382 [Emiliania huxleyi CCMP1516]EOD06987.1 hypothetical protein EMIHUDRAFT_453382 [Emiliania huxleyi CCMP1516]|eukprot:XP_005759416.1 hypothetical protein EMIHUDRAFT_453382 [Emiliania huxleyi CCMP1516]